MAMTPESKYAARKFWLASLSILIITVLVVLKFITGEQFAALLGVVLTTYTTGNVVDTVIGSKTAIATAASAARKIPVTTPEPLAKQQ